MNNSRSGPKVFDIRERTFRFSVRIVKLSQALPKNAAGWAISSQIIRSGTSIGANVEEAQSCGSRKEFTRCLTIALKEAKETEYWLRIIVETELVPKVKLASLLEENNEIIKILVSIIKKIKQSGTV